MVWGVELPSALHVGVVDLDDRTLCSIFLSSLVDPFVSEETSCGSSRDTTISTSKLLKRLDEDGGKHLSSAFCASPIVVIPRRR
jgi:hypothetical protein